MDNKINQKKETINKTKDIIYQTKEIIYQTKEIIKEARKENKGIGAGGANTNKSGKEFEKKTDIVKCLDQLGFELNKFGKGKFDKSFEKEIDGIKIIFVQQSGFVTYCKKHFDIKFNRNPDEAFIIKRNEKDFEIKIIEKKNQTVSGTVDSKVYNGVYFKYEYLEYLKQNKKFNFNFDYSYCLSEYFKNKFEKEENWKITKKFLEINNIKVFFPCEENCFQNILDWILPDKLKLPKEQKIKETIKETMKEDINESGIKVSKTKTKESKNNKIKNSDIDEITNKLEKELVV